MRDHKPAIFWKYLSKRADFVITALILFGLLISIVMTRAWIDDAGKLFLVTGISLGYQFIYNRWALPVMVGATGCRCSTCSSAF